MRFAKWKPMSGYSYQPPVGSAPVPYTATLAPFRQWTYGLTGGLKAVVYQHYTLSLDYYEAIKKGQKQNDLRERTEAKRPEELRSANVGGLPLLTRSIGRFPPTAQLRAPYNRL